MLPEFFYFSDSLGKSREDSSLRGEPRSCIKGGFATKENRIEENIGLMAGYVQLLRIMHPKVAVSCNFGAWMDTTW